MDGVVTMAALFSAVLHATWSAMAYRFPDQAVGFAMMGWVSVLFGLMLVTLAEPPAPASWPWILASIAVHVVYTVALIHANGLARFSEVYPISRGLAPVLVASMIPFGIGDALTSRQLISVTVVVAGLLVFASVEADASSIGTGAVPVALMVSALIASYTTIDGLGVRRSGSTLGYTGWLSLGQGLLTALVLQSRRDLRTRMSTQRKLRKWATLGGTMASVGYATMIWAQQHGTLAVVAALRETSILFATAIGVVIFREGAGVRRMVAATLVVTGIAVLQLN